MRQRKMTDKYVKLDAFGCVVPDSEIITDDDYQEALTETIHGLGVLLTQIPKNEFDPVELISYTSALGYLAVRVGEA